MIPFGSITRPYNTLRTHIMARTEQMHIRVEPELKAEAEAVLASWA